MFLDKTKNKYFVALCKRVGKAKLPFGIRNAPDFKTCAGGAAEVAVAGGLALAIRLRFHNDAPQQLAVGLAFHQQAADELGGTTSAGRAKERRACAVV